MSVKKSNITPSSFCFKRKAIEEKNPQINNIDNIMFLSWFIQDISNVLFG